MNLLAQMLLETCADSRVSNAVTQMTSRFNALLSLTKEVIRRLELQYQEHQQHNALYQECQVSTNYVLCNIIFSPFSCNNCIVSISNDFFLFHF